MQPSLQIGHMTGPGIVAPDRTGCLVRLSKAVQHCVIRTAEDFPQGGVEGVVTHAIHPRFSCSAPQARAARHDAALHLCHSCRLSRG